ncbi:putative membrane protein YpjA [Paenibacillus cellulosilyticus]|uniref:Putative membrane protein YpjA n=1 Tax=Paenibacillus cellulosilyticus TaxID=375489 RepID=A0A2V2YVZ0_9BACL|nr:DUF1405 domain-containing protein [Paenibacillus cellulosilyticus]PWW05526.1 putative membrane protein YpjA [Paenibacillus cellulosilyticus]QKS45437.1 DUF1405 domain-containing protein [Paenibacillus cellulosilyticus]
MSLRLFWSREFLTSRTMLWTLLIVNFLGTIYGYIWYGEQIEWTAANKPLWMLPFVPDSPTASLFFTLSLIYLLVQAKPKTAAGRIIRYIIEALGVATSVKYGIWAVAMIIAGASEGVSMEWQDWMLIVSHLGMAVEGLLYLRFMSVRSAAVGVAAAWLLLNDMVDYRFDVFPWLPKPLYDHLPIVCICTFGLTLFSWIVTNAAIVLRDNNRRAY